MSKSNDDGEAIGGSASAAMQVRLTELEAAVGLPRASQFALAVLRGFGAQQPAEHVEAWLADLCSLLPAFVGAPHRYCDTIADELVRELRRGCGPDAGADEIAGVVAPRAAVEHLARELMIRLAGAARHGPAAKAPEYRRLVAQICRFLAVTDADGDCDGQNNRADAA